MKGIFVKVCKCKSNVDFPHHQLRQFLFERKKETALAYLFPFFLFKMRTFFSPVEVEDKTPDTGCGCWLFVRLGARYFLGGGKACEHLRGRSNPCRRRRRLPVNLSLTNRLLLSIHGKLRLPRPGTAGMAGMALEMGGGTAPGMGLCAGTRITPDGAKLRFTL